MSMTDAAAGGQGRAVIDIRQAAVELTSNQ